MLVLNVTSMLFSCTGIYNEWEHSVQLSENTKNCAKPQKMCLIEII